MIEFDGFGDHDGADFNNFAGMFFFVISDNSQEVLLSDLIVIVDDFRMVEMFDSCGNGHFILEDSEFADQHMFAIPKFFMLFDDDGVNLNGDCVLGDYGVGHIN